MATLYVYEDETLEIVAIVSGSTEKECIGAISDRYDWDSHGSQFSKSGLIENIDAEEINA